MFAFSIFGALSFLMGVMFCLNLFLDFILPELKNPSPPLESPEKKATREQEEHAAWRIRVNQPEVSPFGDDPYDPTAPERPWKEVN
jgi:hypothetical protein